MQLNKLHTMLLLSLCAALTACSDEVSSVLTCPDSDKSPIVLTVGGLDATEQITRAVITDGTNKTMQNFDVNTKIFMIMKSEYSALSAPNDYLNYGGATGTKYTVSRGDVTAGGNAVVFDGVNQKYWDDAHARSSKLNIWAYAQKGMNWTECSFAADKAGSPGEYVKSSFQTTNSNPWQTATIYPMIFNWKASHYDGANTNVQDGTTVMCQDLLFSNNLVNNSSTGTNIGGTDARLAFNTSTRKFPQEGDAVMKFYHAMSKITIKIIEGEGFNTSSTADFQFKSGTNVKLTGFNTEGLFSIQMGGFQQINNHAEIPSIYLKTPSPTEAPYYTLEALAVPNIDEFMQTYVPAKHDDFSRFVADKKDYATDVMMEFIIDNNKYQVTSGQLYDALHEDGDPTNSLVTNATKKTNNGNYIPLEAGKNYVFTFIVGKQKIEHLTAQVAEWENVEADEINPSNARIRLQLEERGIAQTADVAFWKANDNKTTDGIDDGYITWRWKTGYTNLGATYDDDRWTTEQYWQSNKDFYHFRALMPAVTGVTTDDSGDGDYVTLTSAASYTDVRWGAPMLDDGDNKTVGSFKWNYGPTTNGFDADDEGAIASGLSGAHQINKAIGPTKEPVKLILFHMMSDLTFKIKTTSGTDAVTLVDGSGTKTKVEIVGFYPGGKVLLGNGLIKTTGEKGTETVAWNSESPTGTHVYKYGAVPQDLTSVKLYITTPDNNQYIVDLKDAKATSISTRNLANPYSTVGGTGADKDKYLINRWYPGFKYTYSFTLAKTGITNLQATIVDWEEIEADNETIKIQ